MTKFESMKKNYLELSFSKNYILGYELEGSIYYTMVDKSTMSDYMKQDKASRGAGMSIRFRPTKSDKKALNGIKLMSSEDFKKLVESNKYNKGENFEKIIHELDNQEWQKDSTPFTIAGDIEINGTAYQIKFQGATFTNEKIMSKLK